MTSGNAMPEHVAIIMDGNGRWAQQRGLPRTMGHRAGMETLRQTIETASHLGIGHLTLFGFSSENWKRPAAEVQELMGLLKYFVRRDLVELHKANVRIRIIGSREGLEENILKLLGESEKLTAENTGLKLTIAFNYGGRDEISRAARQLVEKVRKGELAAGDINEHSFAACLDTSGLPEPELVIRTGGEQRISNFLIWQMAYSELVFVPQFWPDFSAEVFREALDEYRQRDRRFGGLTTRKAV
jgi:undecaprenyl diphosphate synthase